MTAEATTDQLAGAPDPRKRALSGRAAANNTAAMLASRIFAAVLGLLGTTLIARALPAVEWGYFSFVFGLLGMLAIITDLGVGRAVIGKLVHGEPAESAEIATSFIALRTVLGLLGYGLAMAYVFVLRCPPEIIAATAIAGLVVVIATPSHALTVLFQSTMRLTLVAAAEALARTVQLALTVAAVLWAPTLLVVVVPALLYEVVAVAVKIVGVGRGLGGPIPARHLELRWWGEMLREALPLSIGLGLIIVLQKVGLLLLGHFDSFESVGLFAVGMKFSDLVDTAAIAVVAPMTTLLIALWPAEPDRFRRCFRQATIALLALGLAALVGFWPVATEVVELLFGASFGEAADASRIQIVGGLLGALAHLGLVALMAIGRNVLIPWIALVALGVNLGVSWPLISRLSYEGAAIAGLLAQVVLLVAVWLALVLTLRMRRLVPVATVALVGGLAAAVIVAATRIQHRWDPPWILTSIAACLIYLLLAGGILRRTDGLTIRNLRGPKADETVANRASGVHRDDRHRDSARLRTGPDSDE
ncbi:oligosaccharide flippase family protein [Nocardia sp. NPDC058176]|uniref:oligosaccharide flippase family protein n=1 Tax=Nocardia sp. NPDC058176 TaxID=3346368 RepID=UPI0036D7DDDD